MPALNPNEQTNKKLSLWKNPSVSRFYLVMLKSFVIRALRFDTKRKRSRQKSCKSVPRSGPIFHIWPDKNCHVYVIVIELTLVGLSWYSIGKLFTKKIRYFRYMSYGPYIYYVIRYRGREGSTNRTNRTMLLRILPSLLGSVAVRSPQLLPGLGQPLTRITEP